MKVNPSRYEGLTQERLNSLYNYDPDTGFLVRKKYKSRREHKGKQGNYVYVTIDGKCLPAHRLIWMMVYGHWPDEIDHINGNRTDNRLCNLRNVTGLENKRNKCIQKNNTSGVTGVSWSTESKKLVVRIQVKGKYLYLGSFINKEDAIATRKVAEVNHGFHKNHGRKAIVTT